MQSYFKSILYTVLLGLLILSSCKEVLDQSDPIVLSEEVIYLSGETVRITGRILSLPAKGVDDRGYLIAQDEGFTNPVKVSNGPTDLPGRFVSEYTSLSVGTNYFAKSYVEVDGQMFFGITLNFNTLSPFLTDFEPKTGFEGIIVTIRGGNFTEDTKVFVNGNEAEVIDVFFESKLTFRIPPITTAASSEVKVQVQGQELTFDHNFEYIVGLWNLGTEFIDNTQLLDAASFVVGNEAIIGLGKVDDPRFWSVDLDTWGFQEIPFAGIHASQTFKGSGFIGGGIAAPGGFIGAPWVPNYEFWIYDAGTKQFAQEPLLPFALGYGETVEVANGFYLLAGAAPNGSLNTTIHFFDNATHEWSEFRNSSFQFPTRALYAQYGEGLLIFFQSVIYYYNVQADQLIFLTVYPGDPTDNETSGLFEVIGDRILTGMFVNTQELWEFSLSTFQWKRKTFFPGVPQESNVASWVYNDKLHVLRSARTSFATTDKMQIWTFEPDKF